MRSKNASPKFKVGQQVALLRYIPPDFLIGTIGTIRTVQGGTHPRYQLATGDGRTFWVWQEDLAQMAVQGELPFPSNT